MMHFKLRSITCAFSLFMHVGPASSMQHMHLAIAQTSKVARVILTPKQCFKWNWPNEKYWLYDIQMHILMFIFLPACYSTRKTIYIRICRTSCIYRKPIDLYGRIADSAHFHFAMGFPSCTGSPYKTRQRYAPRIPMHAWHAISDPIT